MKLCIRCSRREGVKAKGTRSCDLCDGALYQIEGIANNIVSKLKDYEYETFLIGAILPSDLLNREDEFRANHKIMGRESIKSQITRLLSEFVSDSTGKHTDYLRPDLTILISIADNSMTINPKSVWLAARYLKLRRGIPQRGSDCQTCNGLGCAECEYKGATESIQSMVSEHFIKKFKAVSCNFIWLGSEDKNSLVKGTGRPFFTEITRPMRRFDCKTKSSLNKLLRFKSNGVQLVNVERLPSRIKDIPQFDIKFVVYLRKPIDQIASRISEVESKFSGSIVNVRLSRKNRIVSRQIRSIEVKEDNDGSGARLTMVCEGGIPIKKFVTGQDFAVEPNLAGLISPYQIDSERPFDIIAVTLRTGRKEESGLQRGRNNEVNSNVTLEQLQTVA